LVLLDRRFVVTTPSMPEAGELSADQPVPWPVPAA
jgi:hypothetical protein